MIRCIAEIIEGDEFTPKGAKFPIDVTQVGEAIKEGYKRWVKIGSNGEDIYHVYPCRIIKQNLAVVTEEEFGLSDIRDIEEFTK